MKTIMIVLLAVTSNFLFAQQQITWVGGTPGKENRWEEPKNWDAQRVPDENSKVLIKTCYSGHNAQPIINTSVDVASIELQDGARLTINGQAKLIIDGTYTYSQGIVNYGGHIINEGIIQLNEIANTENLTMLDSSSGSGKILFDGILVDSETVISDK